MMGGADLYSKSLIFVLSIMSEQLATVVKNAGSHFLLSALPQWKPFPAVLRGKVRLDGSTSTNPVAVGDIVRCVCTDTAADLEHPAVITEIEPRKNHLVRRSSNLSRQSQTIAANIDRVIAAVSLYFPEIKLPFLDRLLVCCEAYGIPAVIALTKTDLYAGEVPDEVSRFHDIYEGAGYRVIDVSTRTGAGMEELGGLTRDGVSLICGESGVGKSSLVKALDPSLNPKISSISIANLQGRHTTSLYEMYPLGSGGYVIDCPGLRGFGLPEEVSREEVYKYFPEMLRVSDECRFVPCTHTHEPGCAVKAALERGEISPERYNSYLGMLERDDKFRKEY